jgi:aryl-alcohol dehydrogenase-like predicted oxidoreductase
MQYRPLGRTGLKVTDICLGTMTWGNQNTEAEGHEQMDYALAAGINFFDTAEMYAVPPSAATYGKTEEIIGTWFAAHKNRDKVIFATKAAGPGMPWVRNASLLSGKTVREAVDASLKRLQTDYIDLYQLHWPNRPFPHFERHWAGCIDFTKTDTATEEAGLLDILTALGDMVKQGKIRHLGLSDDTAWGIMKYLQLAERHNLPRMASIQNEFGILNRLDDPYVAEVCVREDVAYLPWSPLAGGLVAGKYAGGARPKGARWTVDPRKPHRDTPTAHAAVAAYHDIAKKHGLDTCQMAIAFCRQQNFVTSTIIGATTMEQLKTNIGAADVTLGADVLGEINAVYRTYPIPF